MPGLSGHQIVSDEFDVPANDATTAAVACPTGTVCVGGGFTSGGSGNQDIAVTDSAPQNATTWVVGIRNWGNTASSGQVFAVCADGS